MDAKAARCRVPEPLIVEPWFSPRIWGARDLSPFYPPVAPDGALVGEAWLTGPDSRLAGSGERLDEWWAREGASWGGEIARPGEPFPWLLKLLFPRDYLSIQVHPNDAYAAAHGLGRGKTEMWHVLAVQPGARLALGLRAGASLADLAAACRSGGKPSELLNWIAPEPGESYFVPAGTVHALGPGLVILEVQQPSDNTFRLDDYGRRDAAGRPRELHLDAGLAVAQQQTAAGRVTPGADGLLVDCPYFRVRRLEMRFGQGVSLPPCFQVLAPVAGQLPLAGGPALPLGRAAVLPAGCEWEITGEGVAIAISAGAGQVARAISGGTPAPPA